MGILVDRAKVAERILNEYATLEGLRQADPATLIGHLIADLEHYTYEVLIKSRPNVAFIDILEFAGKVRSADWKRHMRQQEEGPLEWSPRWREEFARPIKPTF